jgi:hypothetical protein
MIDDVAYEITKANQGMLAQRLTAYGCQLWSPMNGSELEGYWRVGEKPVFRVVLMPLLGEDENLARAHAALDSFVRIFLFVGGRPDSMAPYAALSEEEVASFWQRIENATITLRSGVLGHREQGSRVWLPGGVPRSRGSIGARKVRWGANGPVALP